MRPSGRAVGELRPIKFTRAYTKYAEGSVLVEYGDTKVICTASTIRGVPRFLKDSGQGWLTAEYGMLPRATHTRTERELTRGKPSGRTSEIQRLIGRALRSVVDLKKLGERTIHIDCDVIQADGGTRTAAISGSCLAVVDAINRLMKSEKMPENPIQQLIASVSVGVYKGVAVLDLDYQEDSNADTDMNVVMTEHGAFVEIQGTAEDRPFQHRELHQMLELATRGITEICMLQRQTLAESV